MPTKKTSFTCQMSGSLIVFITAAVLVALTINHLREINSELESIRHRLDNAAIYCAGLPPKTVPLRKRRPAPRTAKATASDRAYLLDGPSDDIYPAVTGTTGPKPLPSAFRGSLSTGTITATELDTE